MNTTTMIVIALVVLAVVALLIWASARNKARQSEKRDQLRERFGPEYDRAVSEHGSEDEAASHLGDVAKTRDKLEIRDLTPAQRDRYTTDWMEVQSAFVDAPDAAVRDADRLVGAVMRDRGYPVDDFDTKADMIAADHPRIVENYRSAHDIRMRTDNGSDGSGTEDLRTAFVYYRALFAELLDDGPSRDVQAEDRQSSQDQVDLTDRDRTTTQERPER
ncbi:MAG: hypothetical protein ABJA93_01855 [Sporichthyaceae bacterium]